MQPQRTKLAYLLQRSSKSFSVAASDQERYSAAYVDTVSEQCYIVYNDTVSE